MTLPDPRQYTSSQADHPLLRLSQVCLDTQESSSKKTLGDELMVQLQRYLQSGNEAEINAALAAAPSPLVYSHLWTHLTQAMQFTAVQDVDEAGLCTLVFAIPVLIIAASPDAMVIPGIIPDIAEITSLLEMHQAFGEIRNFALSNTLSSAEDIEAIRLSDLYNWRTNMDAAKSVLHETIRPNQINVTAGSEAVHLRFIVGTAITSTNNVASEHLNTIEKWGIDVTRALASQLMQPGLTLLPIPRPAQTLLEALQTGHRVQQEIAFQLAASNIVRKIRAAVGEPTVIISAHRDAEIRVSFSSPFDTQPADGYRWHLSPADRIEDVQSNITDWLASCKISDIRIVPELLGKTENAETDYLKSEDADKNKSWH